MMLHGEHIVCVSWVAWDHVPLVMHQMMQRLEKQNRVLFVDPPFSPTTLLPHPSQWEEIRRAIHLYHAGPEKVAENLWVYRPPPIVLPFGHVPWIDRQSRQRLMRSLMATARALDFQRPIVWAYDSQAFQPDGSLNEQLVCYDCNDDVSSFARFPHKRKGLQRRERWFCEQADLVFATSQALYREKRMHNANAFYFPSGVDLALFNAVRDEVGPLPVELASLPRPCIGYVGAMTNYRIAWDWLEHLAVRHPEWSLVLVGPTQERPPASVRDLPNLHFLGPRPASAIPRFIKGFDIGVIPYKGQNFLQSCQPTKTFEYLAMGKPVVATRMPELEFLAGPVLMADNKITFEQKIQQALDFARDPAFANECIAATKTHSWDARVEQTAAAIESRLKKGYNNRQALLNKV